MVLPVNQERAKAGLTGLTADARFARNAWIMHLDMITQLLRPHFVTRSSKARVFLFWPLARMDGSIEMARTDANLSLNRD